MCPKKNAQNDAQRKSIAEVQAIAVRQTKYSWKA